MFIIHLSILLQLLDTSTFANSSQIADKNPHNFEGNTPLHLAALGGHLEVCKLIFDYVDEKNPDGGYGNTPLHLAVTRGHVDVCKLFIANIDDLKPTNFGGKIPKDIAKERNHVHIIQMFRLAAIQQIENKVD